MISYLNKKTGIESAVTLSMPLPQPYLIGGTVMDRPVISKRRISSQVKKICEVCGVEFWVKPSHADRRKTCSRKCMGLLQTKKIVLSCCFCGKDVEKCPSQLKKYDRKYESKNVFCNKDCMTKFHAGDGNPNRKKENEVSLKCKNCGSTFYRPYWLSFNPTTKNHIKFCSRDCYNDYVLKKSGVAYNGKIEVVCAWCGKSKKVTRYNYMSSKSFFCDWKCQGEYQAVFNTGENCHNYRGGLGIQDLTSYDTYNDKVNFKIQTRRSIDGDGLYLEVRCSYCGKWFKPSMKYFRTVLNSFKHKNGDLTIYCSNECKKECPVFWQRKYTKVFKRASSREVSPDLRHMCLERDGWKCQKCGKSEPPLHCHHIEGATQNKMISNDIDNVITLCKSCHKEVHKQEGCKYHELQCKQ